MSAVEAVSQYVVFDPSILLGRQITQRLTVTEIDQPVWDLLHQVDPLLTQSDYTIDSMPWVKFHPAEHGPPGPEHVLQKIFSASSPSAESADKLRNAVRASIAQGHKAFQLITVNPAISVAEYSVPVAPDGALFGTLDDARRLIRANELPEGLDGRSVNVVLVDTGIDKNMLPPGQFGGGWQPLPQGPGLPTPPAPGFTTGEDALHGMMIVNNILAMAPKAVIFDVPLIPPPKIFDIFGFLAAAEAAYEQILKDILWLRDNGKFTGPWIFMNAWAIYDRRSEGNHVGEYTENLFPGGHPFIDCIRQVAKANFDIVFCAGNCGEVCPDDRCGPNDYGPGRGIWGANAHRDVMTTGAVRVDALWPGYSSEGPGPTPNLYAQKPDLCAPSQFLGAAGVYPPNTGTSASAAITAGVVCALRSKPNWNQTTVPPYVLKLILNNTAMQTQGFGWNRWLGNGILDAGATYEQLLASFP